MAIKRDMRRLLNGKDPYASKVGGMKRRLAQREADYVFISERYLKGYTHKQIVDELNALRDGQYQLSVQQIYKDMQVIHKRWMTSYLVNFDEAKAKELAHVDALEQEYWDAWRKSQKKIEEVESESIQDMQGNKNTNMPSYSRKRVKKKEVNRDGQYKFLEGIQWCINQRCKILGLTIPQYTQNINVNWREQAEAQGVDPDGAVNELVEQFIRAAQPGVDGTGGTGSVGQSTEDH